MPQFLKHSILGNTVFEYLMFLVSLIAGIVVIRVIRRFAIRHFLKIADKTKSHAGDQIIINIRKYLIPAAYLAVLYLSKLILKIGPKLSGILDTIILTAAMILAALFISSIIVLLFNKYLENKGRDANRDLAAKTISGLFKILVWVIAVILFLDNMGLKINTLIAGVGIGGIAVAFAAQSILGDIFCFFTIFFDRPFEIGDFIIAGDKSGTVEHIGLKTTRLRALTGEQLIFSNTDLTNSRIQNFKTMEKRRVLFTLSVNYDTSGDKLRQIPEMIKNIIESYQGTAFGRAHFASYGESGLNFEVMYHVLSSDYTVFLDIHQQINLSIKEGFEKLGVELAFPTRTIRLENSGNQ